jgi:hypothetical protein
MGSGIVAVPDMGLYIRIGKKKGHVYKFENSKAKAAVLNGYTTNTSHSHYLLNYKINIDK